MVPGPYTGECNIRSDEYILFLADDMLNTNVETAINHNLMVAYLLYDAREDMEQVVLVGLKSLPL